MMRRYARLAAAAILIAVPSWGFDGAKVDVDLPGVHGDSGNTAFLFVKTK